MKDIKYLAAYLIPLTAFLALNLKGYWSYSTVIFAFGIIPALEPFLPKSTANLEEVERTRRIRSIFFDWLLYLNIPILYFIVYVFLNTITQQELTTFETVGLALSCGIVVGASGINVAHELGHRLNPAEQLLSKILLLPALYLHFFIEHNRGHHKYVATDRDPASAKFGENLYFFWVRSIIKSYFSAWRLEMERLKKSGKTIWSFSNQMIHFSLIQGIYLVAVFWFWGQSGLIAAISIGVIGILLLETINYIEHYGLRRNLLDNGRYERVMPYHSWNANYELGRIVLYELTRHSDHHYLASKKYQLLDHHEQAPELPVGYPASMLMALIPPLWFAVMHPQIRAFQRVA